MVNVVAFEKAVGRERAATDAVSASVWKKYRESVREEELGVAGHAGAVIAKTVEEDDSVAIAVEGMDGPGAEGDGVWRGDGNIVEGRIEVLGQVLHRNFFFLREGAAGGMEGTVGYEDAGY